MKTKNILKIMQIFAWIALIGLSIQAGGIIITYFISLGNTGAAKDLYQGLNLLAYKQNSIIQYTLVVTNRILQFCLQAYIAFLVTRLLSNLNIENGLAYGT